MRSLVRVAVGEQVIQQCLLRGERRNVVRRPAKHYFAIGTAQILDLIALCAPRVRNAVDPLRPIVTSALLEILIIVLIQMRIVAQLDGNMLDGANRGEAYDADRRIVWMDEHGVLVLFHPKVVQHRLRLPVPV